MEPEPTRYDLRWRMFGVPVRVHPLFWLVSLLLGWGNISEGKEFLLIWVACVFVSVLVHELGHVFMGMLFGSRGYVVLYGMGGLAVGSSQVNRRWQRILVFLAGPGAELLVFVLPIWLVVFQWHLVHVRADWERHVGAIIVFLFYCNLFWAILNLLPIWPLDGGRIARELCEAIFGRRGVSISLGISLVVAGGLAAHGVLAQIYGKSFIPYMPVDMFMTLFFAMFAVTSFQAMQIESYQRRQWEDDDWGWGR